MSQKKVIGWWKYNPLLQKPTTLDPVRPWGWFWYYGPDPASGCSYGQYHDEDNDFDMITAKDKIVYSPATGKPMQFVGPVPQEEFADKVSKVTGVNFNGCRVSCTSCAAALVSDYDLGEMDEVHCCKCGELCETTNEEKTIKGEKTMTKVSASREERIQGLKRRIRANIAKKKKVEAAKERRVRLDEEERKKRRELTAERSRLALKNNRRVKAEDEEKEEDEELISLDSIMEAMEEEECDEGAEVCEDAYLDDEEAEEECDEGEVCAADEDFEEESVEEVEDSAEAMDDLEEEPMLDEAVEEPSFDETDEEEPVDLDGEEQTPADEPVEDEYYDLDMVLSMINKKEKMLKTKKAKKKAKAEEGAEVCEEKDKEKESEFSLLDEEEAEEPAEEPAAKEDLEAMKFEPLAALSSLKNVRKEDIDMALYHEDTQNPTWNVTVAGVPTAAIQLKNQSSPDEIRAVFCSEDYAKDLMIHCEKTGFIQTMNKVKADFWSNHTSNKKIAERFTKEAKASFETERKKLLATFRQDFRNCINIVSAGMSKNFYPDMGNALKEHMFTNLRTVGLPEQTAISCVEKSFTEGSAQYFDSLFEKSEEYMNLSNDARKEIAAAISHGSSIAHAALENTALETLSDRVAQASLVPNMISGTPLKVTRDVLMDTESYKAELRSVWRK